MAHLVLFSTCCKIWSRNALSCMAARLANVSTAARIIDQATRLHARRAFALVTTMLDGMMTLGSNAKEQFLILVIFLSKELSY